MGAELEQIRAWFTGLPPQERVDWLEVQQTAAGLTGRLLATLPERRRPGQAEAWVLGPVDPAWLATPPEGPAYVLSVNFGQFLSTEYNEWYGEQ